MRISKKSLLSAGVIYLDGKFYVETCSGELIPLTTENAPNEELGKMTTNFLIKNQKQNGKSKSK